MAESNGNKPGGGNGESFSGKVGPFAVAAKGPVGIILLSLYAGIGLNVYFAHVSENVRRVVEQEARLEVATIKAGQGLILQSVARYCGVPGLDTEMERIQAEYKQRRDYINNVRDKIGIPRISGSRPLAQSETDRERDR